MGGCQFLLLSPVKVRHGVPLQAGFTPGGAPRAQDKSPGSSLLAQADAAYRAGRWEDARRLLEQAVQADPRSAPAHARLGLTLARLKDPQGALENLRQAHDLEPDNADYAYNYAVLLLEEGQYAPLLPSFETCTGSCRALMTFW